MSFGITYTLPHDVYPRYGYLQSWTKRLFKRFKENIESNCLHACVCDCYGNLEEIKQAEQCLQKPIVTVFAQKESQRFCLGKDLVQALEPFRNKPLIRKDVSWNDFIQDGEKDKKYNSKILVVIATDTDREIVKKLAKLTQTQKENTFIYNPSERSHRLFETVPELESLQGSLSENIQSVLELKVVMVLEKIASYMKPLVPMEGQEQEKSLLVYIAEDLEKLNESLRDLFAKDEQYSKLTEGDFLTKTLNGEAMQKLGKHVAEKVKCMIIEYLSRMNGVRSMVTATLVSDKSLNFEDKFAEWISKGTNNQIGAVLKRCKIDSGQLIHEVEIFIQEKYELLENVRRHQFELHGLLRQSTFSSIVMKEIKLSHELQDELLRESGVTGCGTIYGILTLHASSELALSTKQKIKQILQKYNYHKGYNVQLLTSMNKHVGPTSEEFDEVGNGFSLIAECADAGNTRTTKEGTLGCFVKVKRKSSSPPQNQCGEHLQQESGEESELHCITCAHCVANCNDIVKSKDERPFAEQTDFCISSGEIYDIALLRIIEDRHNECIHEMRTAHEGDYCSYPWKFPLTSEGLAGKPVYKIGSNLPHYTYGVIAGDNFKTINEFNEKRTDRPENPLHVVDPNFNIIICSDKNGVPFSRLGDSGAVICHAEIDKCYIDAIAILHGAFTRDKNWLYSYSAPLKESIQLLEKEFQIEIREPTFHRNMPNPFIMSPEQEGAEVIYTRQDTAVGEPSGAKGQEILRKI